MEISGSVTIGGPTSGDTVSSVIAALDVSDVSIGNGSTYFGKDGSGYLANESITWDSRGTLTIKGNIGNKNETTWNGFELNTDKGVFRMYGPSSVQELKPELPGSNAEEVDLFKIRYEVDADTLRRVATMYFESRSYVLRLDPIEGVSFLKRNADESIVSGWWIQDSGMYFYKDGETYTVQTTKS